MKRFHLIRSESELSVRASHPCLGAPAPGAARANDDTLGRNDVLAPNETVWIVCVFHRGRRRERADTCVCVCWGGQIYRIEGVCMTIDGSGSVQCQHKGSRTVSGLLSKCTHLSASRSPLPVRIR